jgi:hypothetical protein
MAHTRRALSERTRLAYVEGDIKGVTAYADRAKMDKIPDVTVGVIRAQVAIQEGKLRGIPRRKADQRLTKRRVTLPPRQPT